MTKTECIFIDPRSNILYSSYYIQGLFEVFGKKNVKFSSVFFNDLIKRKDDYSYDSYMAFVILNGDVIKKVVVDFGDNWPIRENAYGWCDVYAKINYNPERTALQFKDKILPIPPGFGIKIWNVFEALKYSFLNLIILKFKPQISLKKYIFSYLSQFKQIPLRLITKNVKNSPAAGNYVFFISSLWKDPNCLTGTNLYRKMFVESCLRNNVNFDGGFWANDRSHPQFDEFKEITFTKRYPLRQYVQKTKQSALVFNTPAVHNCHGWKLGQYLAMNKAIISTPFQNSLSIDLVHGENIHYVKNKQELDAGLNKILHDDNYRKKLEKGAATYYLKNCAPHTIIVHISQKLNLKIDYE